MTDDLFHVRMSVPVHTMLLLRLVT